ncbi:hypothetical protein ACN38_g10955 [Penicillium nordicum]|uniref:Secreted protein n=1 Tax=Penicillium nordicum TaxID=229535 RepID=A0A0M8P0Q4_9EURO|nr:hypothetical protein ACN38_g10955 [Penicillium nordicum]
MPFCGAKSSGCFLLLKIASIVAYDRSRVVVRRSHGSYYNSLPYKDSPTPKLTANRSANFLQIHFTSTSDSI